MDRNRGIKIAVLHHLVHKNSWDGDNTWNDGETSNTPIITASTLVSRRDELIKNEIVRSFKF